MLPIAQASLRNLVAMWLLAQSAPVWAVLGEVNPAPVATRSIAAGTRPNDQPAAAMLGLPYQTLEVRLENGTVVKEFASVQGRIFAVSWSGPVLPDFSSLLGTHFPSFARGAEQSRATGAGQSTLNLNRDGLVMRSTGRMRSFEGYAYVPLLVPAGVEIDDVLR
jgi:Protein of unknown function (DUF2844)